VSPIIYYSNQKYVSSMRRDHNFQIRRFLGMCRTKSNEILQRNMPLSQIFLTASKLNRKWISRYHNLATLVLLLYFLPAITQSSKAHTGKQEAQNQNKQRLCVCLFLLMCELITSVCVSVTHCERDLNFARKPENKRR
jgi:hypothetical protein